MRNWLALPTWLRRAKCRQLLGLAVANSVVPDSKTHGFMPRSKRGQAPDFGGRPQPQASKTLFTFSTIDQPCRQWHSPARELGMHQGGQTEEQIASVASQANGAIFNIPIKATSIS